MSPDNDPLAQQHEEWRRKAQAGRRQFKREFGPLATAIGEAFKLCDQMKADGASREERTKVIEIVLREHLPHVREWKYLCEECRDTGMVITEGVTNHLGIVVDEGRPCHCPKGDRFKPKAPTPDDLSDLGKSKAKPRGFARLGRW